MQVDEQIANMIFNLPALFQHRTPALNQLFCVVGNGYKWRNGEIVPCEPRRDRSNDDIANPPPELVATWREQQGNVEAKIKSYRERRLYLLAIRREADRRCLPKWPEPQFHGWYPLWQGGSLLANIPDDVQPDWLNAALEVAEKILATTADQYLSGGAERHLSEIEENWRIARDVVERRG